MKQKICGLLAMLMLLSGCGSSTPVDTSPMSEDEITQMYSDPESFKGRTLELYGRVFNETEYDDDGVYFQMWGDPENGERNTIVACKDTSLKLQDDDYVHISGSVSGKYEGENALGGKITAPAIVADSVEVVTYQEACAPTLYTATVQTAAQTQCGYTVSVDSVELAAKETRVAVTVANNGAAAFSIYDYSAKIVQNGKQFEREYNSYADYPELQSDLMVGASTTGIITFPALEKADFDITLTGASDNWDESIAPFTFHCTFGDAAAQTQQTATAEQADAAQQTAPAQSAAPAQQEVQTEVYEDIEQEESGSTQEDMASKAVLNYCVEHGNPGCSVTSVETRASGGYYVHVYDEDADYEHAYVVLFDNGAVSTIGEEVDGELLVLA